MCNLWTGMFRSWVGCKEQLMFLVTLSKLRNQNDHVFSKEIIFVIEFRVWWHNLDMRISKPIISYLPNICGCFSEDYICILVQNVHGNIFTWLKICMNCHGHVALPCAETVSALLNLPDKGSSSLKSFWDQFLTEALLLYFFTYTCLFAPALRKKSFVLVYS